MRTFYRIHIKPGERNACRIEENPHQAFDESRIFIYIRTMRRIVPLLAMALSLTSLPGWSAGTPPSDTLSPSSAVVAVTAAPQAQPSPPRPSRAELALFAMGLIGAIYKPGGDNPDLGMDCSGFVRYVYHEVAGLTLPHSALALSKIHAVIAKTDLKPGDLVFFKTMRHAFSHVGIYLGDDQFIHASSSRTGVVMISHLDESYWSTRYEGARRVLTATAPAPDASSAASGTPIPLTNEISTFAR